CRSARRWSPCCSPATAARSPAISTEPPRPTRSGGSRMRVVGTLIMAVLLAAAGSAQAQERPRYGGELIFLVPSEPPSYDRHREGTFGTVHPLAPLYNTLLRMDPLDRTGTRPSPDLAESWTISSDGLTYTFKLRPGVRFH